MEYLIEVDEQMDKLLVKNASARGMSVPALITEMLARYSVDSHIMEQSELWQNGINECADINLDWANL